MVKIRNSELFHSASDNPMDELAGVCVDGIHYYDFKNIVFITNTDIASLIDLVRYTLEKGLKVHFVNVNVEVRKKINSVGLDHILTCD